MQRSDFDRQADALLALIFDSIDRLLGDLLEIDLEGGILHIEMQDGASYVINKHGPNQEIWLSSPVSGAWHFAYRPEGAWRATRGGGDAPELLSLLSAELAEMTGRPVAFDPSART